MMTNWLYDPDVFGGVCLIFGGKIMVSIRGVYSEFSYRIIK